MSKYSWMVFKLKQKTIEYKFNDMIRPYNDRISFNRDSKIVLSSTQLKILGGAPRIIVGNGGQQEIIVGV